MRLDELLVSRGFMPTIEEAKPLIMTGNVFIDDIAITTPGTLCDNKCRVRIKEKKSDYVSRGGDKLHHFIEKQSISVSDKCCLDIGISTGGFSDVLLKKNALHILGIDVGYGILDFQLRKNNRLSLLERTNAREVTKLEINTALKPHHINVSDIEFVTMDVSFISVFKILPNLINILNKTTQYIILIKPQFEAEKDMIDLGGVITNEDTLQTIRQNVEAQFNTLGMTILSTEPSALKGTKGNQEYFYHVTLSSNT